MEVEHEPIPIELQRPELEIAWRGLLYSVEAGFISREDAAKTLDDWNNNRESEVVYCHPDTGL